MAVLSLFLLAGISAIVLIAIIVAVVVICMKNKD